MGIVSRSGAVGRKPNDTMKLIVTTFVGVVFGFLTGVSFPTLSLTKFSEYFTILLFHYDGITTEWDDLEWSKLTQ